MPTAHACVFRNWIRRRDYSLIVCDVSCAFDIPCFSTSNFPAPRISSSFLAVRVVSQEHQLGIDLYLLLGFRLVTVRFQITNCRVLPQLLPAVESIIHHGYVVVIISQGSELVSQLLPLDRSARKPQCCSDVLLLGVVTSHVTRQFRSQIPTVTACLFLSSTGRVC